jgi:hypothetical protein
MGKQIIPDVWLPIIAICVGMVLLGFTIGFLKILDKMKEEKQDG